MAFERYAARRYEQSVAGSEGGSAGCLLLGTFEGLLGAQARLTVGGTVVQDRHGDGCVGDGSVGKELLEHLGVAGDLHSVLDFAGCGGFRVADLHVQPVSLVALKPQDVQSPRRHQPARVTCTHS